MTNIAIIGMGELGTALFQKFKTKENLQIKTFDKNIPSKSSEKDLSTALINANYVFICAPTKANPEIAKMIALECSPQTIAVSFSKGVDAIGRTASEVLDETVGGKCFWAVVGGPMVAEEILGGNIKAVIGSINNEVIISLTSLLKKADIEVFSYKNPHVVSFLGILKNVYAVGYGIATFQNLKDEQKTKIINGALSEMRTFLINNKVTGEIVGSPAGKDDLIATATSPNSRNHQIGVLIAKNKATDNGAEALDAGPQFVQRFHFIQEKMPLFFSITQIINKELAPESLDQIISKLHT